MMIFCGCSRATSRRTSWLISSGVNISSNRIVDDEEEFSDGIGWQRLKVSRAIELELERPCAEVNLAACEIFRGSMQSLVSGIRRQRQQIFRGTAQWREQYLVSGSVFHERKHFELTTLLGWKTASEIGQPIIEIIQQHLLVVSRVGRVQELVPFIGVLALQVKDPVQSAPVLGQSQVVHLLFQFVNHLRTQQCAA